MSRCAGLLLAIVVIFQGGLAAAADTPTNDPVNVMLLYAGDLFTPAAIAQDTALRQAIITGTSRSVSFHLETLQADAMTDRDFEVELADFIHRKYQGKKIDLVIAGGGLALDFLERNRPALWPGTPAIFFSVSEGLGLHYQLSPGITGLTIKFDPTATVAFALQLQPKARRVVVVSGVSEDDRYWVPEIQKYVISHHPNLSVTCLTNQTVAELSAQLHRLPADTIVIYTTVFVDAAGKHYVPRDVAARLSAAAGAPLYAMYDTMLNHGIIGGVMPDLKAHGRRAGELALRIIAGESPEAIPVQPARAGVPVVDWRQLQRWHISASRLPPGAKVRFRSPTLWEQHRDLMFASLGILIAQAATIGWLLLHRARRRSAEAAAFDLGSRLIGAQEDERRRLASELHDDMSQSLALLSVELDMFGQNPPAGRTDISRRMQVFSAEVKELSSDVHRLSHELHPAKLEQLGLAAAVRGFCKELANAHEIAIQFQSDDLPAGLPKATALCLYRITQEALQNIVKHSGAVEARVGLKVIRQELQLLIADDGAGFDPLSSRNQGSLGLVSMHERVRMVGGRISIRSQPGNGTLIEVRVPLPAEPTGKDA